VRGQYGEGDELRRIAEFLRDRLKGRRICDLLPLIWFDEMAWRTVLLSQTLAAVGICRNSAPGGEDDDKAALQREPISWAFSWGAS
jgi:hypothetical protein